MRDRKSQILDAASELLECRSFSSFSYKDLSDRLGISKASIHHHFPTKESLGLALVDRLYSRYEEALDRLTSRSESPWERLDGYVSLMSEFAAAGDRICPSSILQAEVNVIPESMRVRLERQCQLVQSWLTDVVERGREAGVMTFTGEGKDQALMIHAAIQGALQSARAQGSEVFHIVSDQLRRAMQTQKTKPASRRVTHEGR